ncbi:MAG: cation diffusion facilitator family transporter [Bacteroidales bacterium]
MDTNPNEQARRIIWIGFFANILLTVLKLVAGILARSSAMIADAVHSVSDFATDLVVVSSLSVAARPKDHNHKYGHGKVETLATAFVGGVLILVGLGLFYSGVMKIWASAQGEIIPQPGMAALYAAIGSIIVKEILFRYTFKVGCATNSQAVIANAWHHRSDAYSSSGTMLGISGAIFLGEQWVILDPLAAVIVSFFIFRVAIRITRDTLMELIETSLPREHEQEILQIASGVEGVHDPHELKTRKIGNHIAIDIHIKVHNHLNIEQAHKISTDLEKTLRNAYGKETHISIHTEPLKPYK